jgi:hypothetical protein
MLHECSRRDLRPVRWSEPISYWTMIAWLPMACAGFVILGSLAFRTTRVWRPMNGTGWSSWQEGAYRWAGWTLLCGVVALTVLVIAALLPRRWGALVALTAAGPFAVAAHLARQHWLRLLAERHQPRDYSLHIASGLPVVTVAGAVGAGLVLVVAAAWLWQAARDERSDTAPSPDRALPDDHGDLVG